MRSCRPLADWHVCATAGATAMQGSGVISAKPWGSTTAAPDVSPVSKQPPPSEIFAGSEGLLGVPMNALHLFLL